MSKIKYLLLYPFSFLFKILEYSYLNIKYNEYRLKYDIDESFRFNGKDILFYGEGIIMIGANSYIGDYSTIQAKKDFKVVIGNSCAISHNVRIYTSNYDAKSIAYNNNKNAHKRGDVFIGNNCWIGANVFIKENIKIGNNTVIAANSVVTKDIPDNCIAGGVPARVISKKE